MKRFTGLLNKRSSESYPRPTIVKRLLRVYTGADFCA